MRDVLQETKILVERIVSFCKPEKVILFGSLARGQIKKDSDIDLLIIKDSVKKRVFRVKEIFEALRGLKRDFPLDPIVYTPKELKHRLMLGDYFIKRVLKEGKVLYE